MRVLIAPDGFGGTLSGAQAAAAIADGWRAIAPEDELDLAPLSDGGPGLLDVLAAALPAAVRHPLTVEDPLARPIEAAVLLDGSTVYVEAAKACGLHLLADAERDPKVTTSYGVGQLVAHAVGLGARTVVVGLGGSATNDGGAGMLAARRAAADRAGGRTGGRPTVWTAEELRTARAMRASGEYDVTSIAKVLGVSRASVYRVLVLPSNPEERTA